MFHFHQSWLTEGQQTLRVMQKMSKKMSRVHARTRTQSLSHENFHTITSIFQKDGNRCFQLMCLAMCFTASLSLLPRCTAHDTLKMSFPNAEPRSRESVISTIPGCLLLCEVPGNRRIMGGYTEVNKPFVFYQNISDNWLKRTELLRQRKTLYAS